MFDAQSWRGFVNTLTVQTEGLNAEAAKSAMVATAVAARDRVLGGTPKPSGYRQVVDGIEGAQLADVRPDGVIVFAWQYLAPVVQDTYGALVNRSPVVKGDYTRGIRVLVDGNYGDPDAVPEDAKTVHIVATVPYARRLEVGRRRGGASFVIQVAPHIVEETATVARRLWGTVASFQFVYVDLAGAYRYRTKAASVRRHFVNGVARAGSVRRIDGEVESIVRYPAIMIEPRTA